MKLCLRIFILLLLFSFLCFFLSLQVKYYNNEVFEGDRYKDAIQDYQVNTLRLLYINFIYRVGKKKTFTRLAGCGIKSMRPIFKTEMLMYQLKANFDEKSLFGKITYHLDPDFGKFW